MELVVTPLLGEMLALVVKSGALFETATLSVSESVPPSLSVAVAVHMIVSDGEAVELVKVRLELVPRVVVPLVQA